MSMPRFRRTIEIRRETVSWLWPGYIPAGKLTLLDGDPGLGKSLITIDLAARLSNGRPMPDGTAGGLGRRTLILQAEDGAADTLCPRLAAAGADQDHVFALDQAAGQPVRLPRDLPALERMILTEDIVLVAIDPLVAFLSRRVGVGNDQVVRRLLGQLAALAARTRAAILLVRHLNKTVAQKALYRGGGSIGIIGAVRSALLAAIDPTKPERMALTPTKANLGPSPTSLGYRLTNTESGAPVVTWEGPVVLTADEALHPSPVESVPEPGEIEATDWLMQFLKDGPRPALEVLTAARAAGISERTLARAKKPAQVESKLDVNKETKERRWLWKLYKSYLPPLPELEELW